MTLLLAVLLCGFAFLWGAAGMPPLFPPGRRPSGGVAALILLALLCSPALAQPAAGKGPAKPAEPAATTVTTSTEAGGLAGDAGRFTQHDYVGTGYMAHNGPDRKAFVAARIDARLSLPLGAHLLGRLDATAQRDGAAPEFTDPQTFDVLEGTVAVARPLSHGVGPIAGYGWTVPMESGRPALVERYPRRWFAGALVWHPEAWMLTGYGKDEASGQGGRLIFAGQLHVTGRSYVGADGALPGLVRSYVLLRVGGAE